MERRITDDIDKLRQVLPPRLRAALDALGPVDDLLEIVLDLGRLPTARYVDREVPLLDSEIVREDLDAVVRNIGQFDADNRSGMERTLHRISAIRNRRGDVIGLTCRVGRAVYGTIEIIQDLIESGQSVLLLGPPGVGKTTMLREAARVLADTKRVVIVDTSNEIGGDGDVPHPAVGRARRMQVSEPARQHEVMIEAVENHNPQVIVIDEIGRRSEAEAARTIAERGVQLIGTAHGNSLDNLMLNPTLSDLIGGIESVTLSDEVAKQRNTQKTVLERKSPPTFEVLVEIKSRDRLVVHPSVTDAVDGMLRGRPADVEERWRDAAGVVHIEISKPELNTITDNPIQTGRSAPPGGGGHAPRERDGRARKSGKRPGAAPGASGGGRTPGSSDTPQAARGGNGFYAPVGHPAYGALPTLPGDEYDVAVDDDSLSVTNPFPPVRAATGVPGNGGNTKVRVVLYGVARNRLYQSARRMGLPLEVVEELDKADAVVTIKSDFRRRPPVVQAAEQLGKPVYVLRANTVSQMEDFLQMLFKLDAPPQDVFGAAMREAEAAVVRLRAGHGAATDLHPQVASIRKQQHRLVRGAGFNSESIGKEPNRFVRVSRP